MKCDKLNHWRIKIEPSNLNIRNQIAAEFWSRNIFLSVGVILYCKDIVKDRDLRHVLQCAVLPSFLASSSISMCKQNEFDMVLVAMSIDLNGGYLLCGSILRQRL